MYQKKQTRPLVIFSYIVPLALFFFFFFKVFVMLMTYPFASSIKSVTELKNCCLSGENTGPKAAGFVSAALLASHCARAHFFSIPMAHASISPVHKLKLPAFAKLAQS